MWVRVPLRAQRTWMVELVDTLLDEVGKEVQFRKGYPNEVSQY